MAGKSPKSRKKATGRNLADALRRAVDDLDDDLDLEEPESEPEVPSKGETASYRIGEVADLVGVDAHVLRYWESEFELRPERSASGQRVYRQPDLSQFLRIKGLLHDDGYTIAGARRVLAGGQDGAPPVDAARIQAALERVQLLRDTVRDIRDQIELDLIQR